MNHWKKLGSDIDGEAEDDNSGWSVSISGNGKIVAIGATGNDSYKGHVRIYQYSGGSWSQLGSDINGSATGDFSGLSISLSNNGLTVAIGAPLHDGNIGQVRVFRYSGGSWSQLGSDIDGAASGDQSGTSVALSNDGQIVAIGAPGHGDDDIGHVRIYQYSGGSWSQLGSDIDGEAASDRAGGAVALSGDGSIVAIGAAYHDDSKGQARIFQYSEGSWTQLGSDIDGVTAGDLNGFSVALSNNGLTVAIGARNINSNTGQVRIYQYSGSAWSQLGNNINGEATGDINGYSISLSNNGRIIAIGAVGNNSNRGYTRIFQYSGGSWTQLGDDISGEATSDQSGFSVSLSNNGKIVAIGAPYNDGNGSNSGQVRIYKYFIAPIRYRVLYNNRTGCKVVCRV